MDGRFPGDIKQNGEINNCQLDVCIWAVKGTVDDRPQLTHGSWGQRDFQRYDAGNKGGVICADIFRIQMETGHKKEGWRVNLPNYLLIREGTKEERLAVKNQTTYKKQCYPYPYPQNKHEGGKRRRKGGFAGGKTGRIKTLEQKMLFALS